MSNIILISVLGVSLLSIIYSLVIWQQINKKSAGSKKMADVAKVLASEIKPKQASNLKDFSLAAIVIFTGTMYAFGWQSAVCFLLVTLLLFSVDYYQMGFSATISIRLAEAARSNAVEAKKINAKFSNSVGFLSAGVALLLVAVAQIVFADPTALLALVLAAVLASVFSRRGGRSANSGLLVATLSGAIILSGFASYQNAEIFPLALVALGIIILALTSVVSRISHKLAIGSIILLAVAYFGPRYLFGVSSKFELIKLASVLIVGLVVALLVLFVRQISKVLPILLVALALLVANSLAGEFGAVLAALGVLAIWPVIFSNDFAGYQLKAGNKLAMLAEMPVAVDNIKSLEIENLKSTGYFILLFGLTALEIVFAYFHKFALTFPATDPKLLSGLLFGGALAYLLASELFTNKLSKVAVAVLATILAGVIFGPLFLVGMLTGAMLIELLVSQSIGAEILIFIVAGTLTATFIDNPSSLLVRGIIAGLAITIIAIFFIIKKIANGRKTINLATGV